MVAVWGVTQGCDGPALERDRPMDGVFETRKYIWVVSTRCPPTPATVEGLGVLTGALFGYRIHRRGSSPLWSPTFRFPSGNDVPQGVPGGT